ERHAQLSQAVEERHALGSGEFSRGDHEGSDPDSYALTSLRPEVMGSDPNFGKGCAWTVRGALELGSDPGASGAMDIIRSAPPITAENTGAPTSPPKYFAPAGSSSITATMKRGSLTGAKPTNEETYLCSA